MEEAPKKTFLKRGEGKSGATSSLAGAAVRRAAYEGKGEDPRIQQEQDARAKAEKIFELTAANFVAGPYIHVEQGYGGIFQINKPDLGAKESLAVGTDGCGPCLGFYFQLDDLHAYAAHVDNWVKKADFPDQWKAILETAYTQARQNIASIIQKVKADKDMFLSTYISVGAQDELAKQIHRGIVDALGGDGAHFPPPKGGLGFIVAATVSGMPERDALLFPSQGPDKNGWTRRAPEQKLDGWSFRNVSEKDKEAIFAFVLPKEGVSS